MLQKVLPQLRIRKTLKGSAPAYKIADDVNNFPSGMFPINSQFSQINFLSHLLHHGAIHTNEPTTISLTYEVTAMQNLQVAKISRSADSNTIYLH